MPIVRILRAGLLLALPYAVDAAAGCAPPYSATGQATYYSPADPLTGACGMPVVDGQTLAIGADRWTGGAHCGEWFAVTGPNGSVALEVTDECPECGSGLDLTQAAFAQIGVTADGVAAIRWQRIDAPVSGNPKLVVAGGSSPYYFKMYADNTLQGVSAISVYASGMWQAMTRSDGANFSILPASMLPQPLLIQLTSQSGEILSTSVANFAAATTTAATQFGACSDRIFASDLGSSL